MCVWKRKNCECKQFYIQQERAEELRGSVSKENFKWQWFEIRNKMYKRNILAGDFKPKSYWREEKG